MWRGLGLLPVVLATLTGGVAGTSDCDAKYASLTPTHVRCLTDHATAEDKTLTDSVINTIVNEHNEHRQNATPTASNMQLMVWDDMLAATALKTAMQCSGNISVNVQEPDYPGVAIGQSFRTGLHTWIALLNRFKKEMTDTNYEFGQEDTTDVESYLQLVFAEANHVGCGVAKCPDLPGGKMRVCNYAKGLDTSVPPYHDGEHCAECPDHCDSSGKLCDCQGKLCYNNGALNLATCECECPETWTGTNCEVKTCHSKYQDMTSSPYTHIRCFPDHENATEVVLDQELKDHILNFHNDLRTNATPTATNMLKMYWDDLLAETALKDAMNCSGNHSLNHNEPDYPGTTVSQNIGLGHLTWDSALGNFWKEKEKYNFPHGPMTPDFVGVGHYFQMAYHASNRVGCAMAICKGTWFNRMRVCNYVRAMDSQFPPYQDGTSCADCPNNCNNNLCDCGDKFCYNNGRLNPGTCECDCNYPWMGTRCETINCVDPDYFNSCQNGALTLANCSTCTECVVRDPNMCPHLCQICPPCFGKVCENGGTLNKDTCQCSCPVGYIGDNCETACSDIPCQNGGTQNSVTCGCTCGSGFGGDRCEIDCSALSCNTGTGVSGNDGNCRCECPADKYGDSCENDCTADQEYCAFYITFFTPGSEYCEIEPASLDCPYQCGHCN